MHKPKILVVDDDNDMRRALHIRLKAQGYDTVFAADGLSTIATVQKESPDLVLLDLGMPAGGGFVVMDWLQRNAKQLCIPVIVLTASGIRANKEKAEALGCFAFFQKPANNAELMSAISEALISTGVLPQEIENGR